MANSLASHDRNMRVDWFSSQKWIVLAANKFAQFYVYHTRCDRLTNTTQAWFRDPFIGQTESRAGHDVCHRESTVVTTTVLGAEHGGDLLCLIPCTFSKARTVASALLPAVLADATRLLQLERFSATEGTSMVRTQQRPPGHLSPTYELLCKKLFVILGINIF